MITIIIQKTTIITITTIIITLIKQTTLQITTIIITLIKQTTLKIITIITTTTTIIIFIIFLHSFLTHSFHKTVQPINLEVISGKVNKVKICMSN